MNRAPVLAFVAAAACGGAAPKASSQRPIEIRPALPTGFALETVLPKTPQGDARLRLDGGGRPFLITKDMFVPAQKLPSGEPAAPYRIAHADEIGDVTWMEEGVMLIVVGAQLGIIGDSGFQPILALPSEGMRVVAANKDSAWLFAPASADGHLYLYEKGDKVSQLLHIDMPIQAVSGTPDRVYVVSGHSLMRVAKGALALVFDGNEDIRAVAAAPDGVLFSTKSGVFYVSDAGAVTRLTSQGASAIEVHGDELFVMTDMVGLVRGAPVSSLACTMCVPDPSSFDVPGAPSRPRRPPPPLRAFKFGPGPGAVLLGVSSARHTVKGSLSGTLDELSAHAGIGGIQFTAGIMRGDLAIDDSDSFIGFMHANIGYKATIGLDIMRGPGIALLKRRAAQVFWLLPSGTPRVVFNDDGLLLGGTIAITGLRFVLRSGLRLDVHVPSLSGWIAPVSEADGDTNAGVGHSWGGDAEIGWTFW